MDRRNLLEIRRQVAHLCFGILLSLLIFLEIIDAWFLTASILTFLSFVLYIKFSGERKYFFRSILLFFERDEHMKRFPGRGFFFFLLGSLLSVLFFPKDIALASIIILSIGDSVSHIYGRLFGRWKVPWSNDKKVEGHILAALLCAFSITFSIPLFPAIVASSIAMIIEIPKFHIGSLPLDDNLLIPLVSGFVLSSWNFFLPFL